ncbi:Protein of unknown function [Bacillus mycoides]|nr:Protein of unknown function [Bacillus mycoides]
MKKIIGLIVSLFLLFPTLHQCLQKQLKF